MTEEKYFRKHYPDVCYNGKPLSPYWDLFQDGVEFGERQSEKKIKELEKKNVELKAEITKKTDVNNSLVGQVARLEIENAELKNILTSVNCLENVYSFGKKEGMKQLAKAKQIIKDLLADNTDWTNKLEAEQFLKE